MSFLSNVAGAFGFSTTGILSGALKMVGVPDRAAEAAGLAAELARGVGKDGFDFGNVNKGALARHALQAFGVTSPLAALAGATALGALPHGFSGGGGGGGSLAGLAGPVLGTSVMSGLVGQQGGITSLIGGIAGSAGMTTADVAGTGMKMAFGDHAAQVRQQTGLTRANYGPGSMLASLPRPAMFEDIVAAFMIDVVKDKQEKIEEDLRHLEDTDNSANSGGSVTGQAAGAVAPGASDASANGNSDSRNIQFEIIKNEMQKLSQMQQAMSNVLDTMNDQAMSSIRQIKAA
jgi:hypothetical protein